MQKDARAGKDEVVEIAKATTSVNDVTLTDDAAWPRALDLACVCVCVCVACVCVCVCVCLGGYRDQARESSLASLALKKGRNRRTFVVFAINVDKPACPVRGAGGAL